MRNSIRKIINWLRNVFQLSKIIKSLDQAVEEITILRDALDNVTDELEDLRSLNLRYKEELEQLRSERSE